MISSIPEYSWHINPTRQHTVREQTLTQIADLAGFTVRFELLDGTKPDVLRLHVKHRGVFIGEAKHTERPSDSHTYDRLAHYLDWFVILAEPMVVNVVAIAYPSNWMGSWHDCLESLCGDMDIKDTIKSYALDQSTAVTYLTYVTP